MPCNRLWLAAAPSPRGCDPFVAKIAPDFVQIDGCETDVVNRVLDDGHLISNRIAECAADVTNHGQFVSCVAHLTNDLKKDRTIIGKEKGSIQRWAAQADIPGEDMS